MVEKTGGEELTRNQALHLIFDALDINGYVIDEPNWGSGALDGSTNETEPSDRDEYVMFRLWDLGKSGEADDLAQEDAVPVTLYAREIHIQ
jgi:hypothetical protein